MLILSFLLLLLGCLSTLSLISSHSNNFVKNNDKQCNMKMSLKGYDVLKKPWLNKGESFNIKDREKLKLRGLLPAGEPKSLEARVEIAMTNLRNKALPIDKYVYLHSIQDSDERLFYCILTKYTTEVMPYVYTPTVGEACIQWSHLYKSIPRGLYISLNDKGSIYDILDNHPHNDVKVICVTDGERILGLGDLGANGMGIPIGKLALYTACAKINPDQCLPIHIDVGVNRESIRNDPAYIGLRQERERGAAYDELLEEFFEACKKKYGRNVLIQFEDFGNSNAFRLLEKHQDDSNCFNDDIQGTASVVLAGIISSLGLTKKSKLSDHQYLFYGAGEAGVGIADLLASAISKEENVSLEVARSKIWLVDSQGLITADRKDDLAHHKKAYAHKNPSTSNVVTLIDVIKILKPTALLGVSAIAQAFNEEVIKEMSANNENPLIFALSNPTSKAECTATQAYTFSNGKAIFASGSPFDPVTLPDGRNFVPGQGNNAYIFPGIGLGSIISEATSITNDDFYVAAKALASLVSEDRLKQGSAYPPISDIGNVSTVIAKAVATNIFNTGRSSSKENKDYDKIIKNMSYDPWNM